MIGTGLHMPGICRHREHSMLYTATLKLSPHGRIFASWLSSVLGEGGLLRLGCWSCCDTAGEAKPPIPELQHGGAGRSRKSGMERERSCCRPCMGGRYARAGQPFVEEGTADCGQGEASKTADVGFHNALRQRRQRETRGERRPHRSPHLVQVGVCGRGGLQGTAHCGTLVSAVHGSCSAAVLTSLPRPLAAIAVKSVTRLPLAQDASAALDLDAKGSLT
jgi:hypothetical protein